MVQHQQQHVLGGLQAYQHGAKRRPGGQIKRAASLLGEATFSRCFASVGRDCFQIGLLQLKGGRCGDALKQFAVLHREGRAQHVVPLNHRAESRLQPRDVQPADEVKGGRFAIYRRLRSVVMEKPHSLLTVRGRINRHARMLLHAHRLGLADDR